LCTDEFMWATIERRGSFNRLDAAATRSIITFSIATQRHAWPPARVVRVQDIDDLFVGHNPLRRLGKYEHMRGVGYHCPGGQVYDYWLTRGARCTSTG